MSRARSWTRMLGVLVLVGALAAVFAGPASAYTHKQKRHIQRVLLHQLKKHPRLIKNRHWLRKADAVEEVLPLTIRLNPIEPTGLPAPNNLAPVASDDLATLDLSDTLGPSVGVKTTTLSGVVHVDAHFGNPENGDPLGSLQLVATSADLSAASVGVLDSNDGSAAGCPVPPDSTLTSGGTLGSTAAALAPSVDANTVVRTAPIALTLAHTAAPNVGTANLFGTSNNVNLSLHVNAAINTIFRVTDNGTGDSTIAHIPGLTSAFNCDEAYAGQTTGNGTSGNVIPVAVQGSLHVSPALTNDGRLRIATTELSSIAGQTTGGPGTTEEVGHSHVSACLQPAALVDTPAAEGHVNFFETQAGLPLTSEPGNDVATSPPAIDCLATPFLGTFPLSTLGEQEITPASAKLLKLDPNVQVTQLSAEALIGTYAQ